VSGPRTKLPHEGGPTPERKPYCWWWDNTSVLAALVFAGAGVLIAGALLALGVLT